ncbi:hypothetical protein [Pseudomonas extremaustralis]|uniref:hypothetical protein n=1 Tax=Pseudomonas extremaustralis TaxID=359110 RepID=UPI0023DF2631|nr:hypothetical protein [Pseudomonas extremaustralis]MDF3132174.1 hypothetical protein [Pseudomonas extremaustralis]
MIIWAFPAFSIFGLLVAYSMKVILSSKNLGYTKFYLGLAINIFFMMPLLEAFKFDKYLYFGSCPELIETYPSIGWFAFICFLLHPLALPVKRNLNWWWQRP